MKILKCNCGVKRLSMLNGRHHKYGCPLYKKRKHRMVGYDFARPLHKIVDKAHFLYFNLVCNRGGVKEVRITLSPQYADSFCYGYTWKFSWRLTREYTKGKMQILQINVISDCQEYLEEFAERELKQFDWRLNDQTEFGGDVLWVPPEIKR